MAEKFETLAAAGKFLKICRQGVYIAVKLGRLKATRVGRTWHFEKADLIKYLEDKYDRKKKIFHGEPIIDHSKGEYTVMDIVLLFNSRIKRKTASGKEKYYDRQWLYHKMRSKQLPFTRRGILYIIKIQDAQLLYEQEIEKYPQQYKLNLPTRKINI